MYNLYNILTWDFNRLLPVVCKLLPTLHIKIMLQCKIMYLGGNLTA